MRGRLAAQLGCQPAALQVRSHELLLGNETWQVSCGGVSYGCTRLTTTYVAGVTCTKSPDSAAATETAGAPTGPSSAPPSPPPPAVVKPSS